MNIHYLFSEDVHAISKETNFPFLSLTSKKQMSKIVNELASQCTNVLFDYDQCKDYIEDIASEFPSINFFVVSEKPRPVELVSQSYTNTSLLEFTKEFVPANITSGWSEFFDSCNSLSTVSEKLQEIASKSNTPIYPPLPLIYNAFTLTPLDKVKVILLGMDPYIKHGEAHGLCFSVPDDVKAPPSLQNVYKEMSNDGYPITYKYRGNLTSLAEQGVLLLNTALTVFEGKSGSHIKLKLWQDFTKELMQFLRKKLKKVVVLLWGNNAQEFGHYFDDSSRFTVLTAAHPSPLAQGRFFNCKHFSKTNEILSKWGKEEIEWNRGK